MKISDLPPGLKELAELRRNHHANECEIEEVRDDLGIAFPWSYSREGRDFWSKVHVGNFSVYYNCKVVNCKPKVQNLKHA